MDFHFSNIHFLCVLIVGEPFDHTMTMNAAVANIVVSILLSHRFDYEDSTYLRLLNIYMENIQILGSPAAMVSN